MPDLTPRHVVVAALVAGLYALLCLAFAPLSYGAVQVRIAEALTLLPFLLPEAVAGLFVGCLIANFFGGLGLVDVVFGSLATLLAALLTRRMPNKLLAALPPVIVNGLVVGGYLSILLELPFLPTALYVGFGQAVACFGLGVPLIHLLGRRLAPRSPEGGSNR
ncbi:MAG: QueT transporter family protein [Synergistaceae bacterium]|nr:QueT transporter family protein [Synergistaceae bacterium]